MNCYIYYVRTQRLYADTLTINEWKMLNFFKEGKTESHLVVLQSVSECFKDDAGGALRRVWMGQCGKVRRPVSSSLLVLGEEERAS